MTEVTFDRHLPELEPGPRKATVTDCQLKKSKKGEKMLEVTFSLEGGGQVRDYLMLEGAGKGMGLARLSRLGVPDADTRFDTQDLAGRTLTLILINEPYNGQPQLKIDGKANATPFRLGYGSDISVQTKDTIADSDSPF